MFSVSQHEDVAMPYVQLLADFRDDVRSIAREEKGNLGETHYGRRNAIALCSTSACLTFFDGDLEVELCPKIPSVSWFELIFNDNVHLLSSVKTSHVRGHFNNGKELN